MAGWQNYLKLANQYVPAALSGVGEALKGKQAPGVPAAPPAPPPAPKTSVLDTFKKKVGPLPVYGWLVIAAAGGGYWWWRRSKKTST